MGALGGAFCADALWYEPQAVEVEQLSLPLNTPGKGFRIVQLSDLHLRDNDRYFQKVSEKVNQLRPDLIMLTGDYMEGDRNIHGVLDFLKGLKAGYGIYAVQGNWEYWSRLEGENLRRHFAGVGVTLLINQRADLEVNGQAISVLGLDYPSTSDRLQRLQQELDPQRFNLLLSHVPGFPHENLNEHINLILSGHTHGGQVRLPLLPPLYLPRYSGRFVSGLYSVSRHDIPLYVNRGVGTNTFPVRFLCRPEISVIEATAATS